MPPSEADTCRKYVIPKLQAAGWEDEPHAIAEQRTFTDGRIYVVGGKAGRRKQKRADYSLRHMRDIALSPFHDKGSSVKAYQTFGRDLDGLLKELDEVLAA